MVEEFEGVELERISLSELSMFRSVALLASGVILPILATFLLLIWPDRTHALLDDWGWFSIWASYFFLGFLVAGLRTKVLPLLRRTRWVFR